MTILNTPIHAQKVMNILAMYGFIVSKNRYTGSTTMRNKNFAVYFYTDKIHKILHKDSDISFASKNKDTDIVGYTYSDKDILRLIEDIQ